ncbi:alpha/beta fold hydrolase [Chitinophaga flava]|uniref:Alpha/beta hydrolase n=1 Tax=Chitinophaga flava TaxID=2259036 RepID=A0A365XTR1_9BACT|nr:alpha/beta hydrolase [Chitinophaga flava]RBL89742.1 alpha/beta hydrolase [Chitinophaga flava]
MNTSITFSPATFKTVQVNNVEIFYREAGPADAPVILLLHGFPSSSHMYRNLMNHLSARYHVIAPDYPGAGLSSRPARDVFEYTFDQLALIMEKFIDTIGLTRFSLYAQDFGGPVGFRIASKRPELIEALLIQNANAYTEGLAPRVHELAALVNSGNEEALQNVLDSMLSLEGIKGNYFHPETNPERINPDGYLLDDYFMQVPGTKDIQAALLRNYQHNFTQYNNWQQYFRNHQPPTLIVWGKYDPIFLVPGAKAYLKDLPDAELHLLDGGHFLLEEHHQEVATLIDRFLSAKL